jgi:hypothetical protein
MNDACTRNDFLSTKEVRNLGFYDLTR